MQLTKMRKFVPISRVKLRMELIRDAALARKFALKNPDMMEYALRVAALREFAAEQLYHKIRRN